MESTENAAIRSVWQRVQNSGAEELPERERLGIWIGAEVCDRLTYSELAKQAPRFAGDFQKLSAEAAQHVQLLSGLCFLLHGEKPVLRPTPLSGAYGQRLRHCYSRTVHRAKDYDRAAAQWSLHAPLFRTLARELEERSLLLIRIAGK